ncbi:unnamed protein product [Nezara viridula]|uniref:Tetratricopeptide repeat protein n=1 Tax=Nezara viridula TaxID=85310 RepID=A0A9P0HL67_NEZVI|nr:unnamed protein product [Nezara viridula]
MGDEGGRGRGRVVQFVHRLKNIQVASDPLGPGAPQHAYGNLGSVLSSQGRTKEAETAFRIALSFRPNMADVHYNL